MHNILQKVLKETNGPLSRAVIREVACLSSGWIHKTWRLTLIDGEQLFAKTTAAKDFAKLEFEANGLESLNAFSNQRYLEVPKPLVLRKLANNGILILPWLEFGKGDQTTLGKGLALIHQASNAENQGKFGWNVDGFIGAGSQPAGWSNRWGETFIDLRLIPQLEVAARWGINLSDWKDILDHLIIFLEKHKPSPSLVHGDLWSGNAAIQKNKKAIIFDPACWWADREVDIAMTSLFGGFSNNFYKGYESVWPLLPCARHRVEIYNLYHLINHANIFGGSYKMQSISSLNNIKSTLSLQ